MVESLYEGTAGVGLLNNWDINVIPLDISRDITMLNQIFQAVKNYKPYPQFGSIQHFANFGQTRTTTEP